ncbi:MAG: glycosyltransferase family 39 protein [Armatimonadetes bacterium]|nr:glycosyltransferase family 39 protein [Armatimonadota bacterium]
MRAWTLVARSLSVLAGVGTVLAVAAAAEALGLPGWWAGLALSVAPLHCLLCRYGTVDPTLTFMVSLTLLLTALACRIRSVRMYAAAGAAAGLAASTKYVGALVLLLPLLTAALDRNLSLPRRSAAAFWSAVAATAAFFLTSPFVLLSWSEAQRDILFEIQHMRAGEYPAFAAEPSGLWFHAKWLLVGTTCVAVLGAVGLVAGLHRGSPAQWSIVAVAAMWFCTIAAARVRYARYELPLLPFIAIGAASAATLLGRRARQLLAAFCIAAGIHSALISASMCLPDARDQALAFILNHASEGDTVGLVWEPWFQSPPLDYCNGGEVLRRAPLWRMFSAPRRRIVVVGSDARALERTRPAWLVISDVELRDLLRARDPRAILFAETVRRLYEPVAEWNRRAPPALVPASLAPPHDWLYPAMRLTVYRLRADAPAQVEHRPKRRLESPE